MTMELFVPIFLLVFVVAGAFIAIQVAQFYGRQNTLRQFTQSLGFSPVEATKELTLKISRLYDTPGSKNAYEMQKVSHKSMPDCEVYLFDLVEISGGENTVKERQAVAIVSPTLKLPQFIFIPKLNTILTAILERSLSGWGKLLDFPQFPALNSRYLIISREPELAYSFINENLAASLAKTKSHTLYAAGNIFTFSEFHESNTIIDPESMKFRIHLALEIFRKLQK